MVRRLALAMLLPAIAGCLSTPPSGVITCINNCPISGFYCAPDGFCWQNGEFPTTSSGSSTGAGTNGGAGTSGSGGTGSSGGTSGKSTGSSGSSTGHPAATSST
jgi:hypothetical protein